VKCAWEGVKEMAINKETVEQFRADFNKAMEELEEKYDLTIKLGTISYWKDHFTAPLEANAGRDPEQIARAAFDRNVWKVAEYGVKEGMYMRIFVGRDKRRYALTGINTKASRYPLEYIDILTGERYKSGGRMIDHITDEVYVESSYE
jgi:hypothetical protein